MDTEENKNVIPEALPQAEVKKESAPVAATAPFKKDGANRGGQRSRGGRPGGRSGSFARPKPEFDQKIIAIRRVTRVVAGGRRMSFSVAMIIGDKKGSVGFGTGKATDTALAISKALKNARKNMITIKTTKSMSIPHEVEAKFSSCQVEIAPNRRHGIVAGSVVRDIVILAGLKNITGKIHSGSKNRLNNAQAVMKALSTISTKKRVSPVEEVHSYVQQ